MHMNAYLNYIIEANIALALFLGCYHLILKDETRFRLLRIFLITGIMSSVLFPLIDVDFDTPTTSLSIGRVIPSYWLPEVLVGNEGVAHTQAETPGFWQYVTIIYFAGLIVGFVYTLLQLWQLFTIMRETTTYQIHNLRIAESNEDRPIFSFFNFIFIGNAHVLSREEKQQIIAHESVHARQWHSFDILFVNALKILFWFNPLINQYKKTFVQLHEFEADARAVENSDVNMYCSLLARVALQSADYTLANHFNNSLTIKRIEMMRSIKYNIRRWKLLAISAALPAAFFFIACQDQVGDDIAQVARNSSHALIVPEFVKQRLESLKKSDPEKNYVVLELNETATEKMNNLKSTYGLPRSIEIFTAVDGKVIESGIKGEASEIVIEKSKTSSASSETQTFAIVEFNQEVRSASEGAVQEEIFTVVEEQPEFSGGYDSMMNFLRQNLRYPSDARQAGIEGTVYVSFIVWADGAVSEVKVIRGVHESVDREAKRVVEMFPKWKPGRQSGREVSVRFVIPIKFALG